MTNHLILLPSSPPEILTFSFIAVSNYLVLLHSRRGRRGKEGVSGPRRISWSYYAGVTLAVVQVVSEPRQITWFSYELSRTTARLLFTLFTSLSFLYGASTRKRSRFPGDARELPSISRGRFP